MPKKKKPNPLDVAFGQLADRPKFKISAHRIAPSWATGYLGTIDIYEDWELSMETIMAAFSGGTLKIQIRDSYGRYLGHRNVVIGGPIYKDGKELKAPYEPNQDAIDHEIFMERKAKREKELINTVLDTLNGNEK